MGGAREAAILEVVQHPGVRIHPDGGETPGGEAGAVRHGCRYGSSSQAQTEGEIAGNIAEWQQLLQSQKPKQMLLRW